VLQHISTNVSAWDQPAQIATDAPRPVVES
jgi:hypothetical protein